MKTPAILYNRQQFEKSGSKKTKSRRLKYQQLDIFNNKLKHSLHEQEDKNVSNSYIFLSLAPGF